MRSHKPEQSSVYGRAPGVVRSWYVLHRPQTVDELDRETVRESISSFIKRGRFPQALLFAGPKGTGKTSAARIVAKILNCEKLEKNLGEPCNSCTSCTEITKGTSFSVIEIDAASHRGIEDVREIREAVKLLPAGGRTKVYIVDEAHMLTTEAFNALLKTLEEPPSHAVFILATTEPSRLPQTIKSRTTLIPFSQAAKDELMRSLTRVAKKEKLKLEEGVLDLITNFSEGSFRDAIKALEQLAGGDKITIERTRAFFTQTLANPNMLLRLLIKMDTKAALEEIARVAKLGVNIRQFTIQLIEMLRAALLAKLGVGDEQNAISLGMAEIKKLIELLIGAIDNMRISPIAELPLELVVVEWCGEKLEDLQSIRLSRNLSVAGGATAPRGFRAVSRVDSSPLGAASNKRDVRELPISSSLGVGEAVKKKGVKKELKEEEWQEILAKIRSRNHTLSALLRSTRPIDFDGQTLTVSVFYQFHKDKLEEEQNRVVVEEVAGTVLNLDSLRVIFELGEKPKRATQQPENEDLSAEVPQSGTEEDIVKVAEEIFGTESQN